MAVIPAALLILYALVGVNQGVDLADTGYNIGTYRFMFTWDGEPPGVWTDQTAGGRNTAGTEYLYFLTVRHYGCSGLSASKA